ncbi:uncharacterized protein HMPREF1120_01841 [Exophiala dermatitidis NIH/UT8656]|uniref:Uncharacterized protein n=1 Tax=Exophiala dermatitidis (strain ATCC 34100 / CBS 525.76 / NIH/UT8656) TaxID=858893 RepID=H6BPQ2_EXODN|nr:uncharacterized protein HMPREF1120_01841 [Exophiala dermatitidis NIH/UT8656]EHY53654.1 hypothetical protein HMPREF1120_01841 [Exophiala dermatitidis NIH/UT8656]
MRRLWNISLALSAWLEPVLRAMLTVLPENNFASGKYSPHVDSRAPFLLTLSEDEFKLDNWEESKGTSSPSASSDGQGSISSSVGSLHGCLLFGSSKSEAGFCSDAPCLPRFAADLKPLDIFLPPAFAFNTPILALSLKKISELRAALLPALDWIVNFFSS